MSSTLSPKEDKELQTVESALLTAQATIPKLVRSVQIARGKPGGEKAKPNAEQVGGGQGGE